MDIRRLQWLTMPEHFVLKLIKNLHNSNNKSYKEFIMTGIQETTIIQIN